MLGFLQLYFYGSKGSNIFRGGGGGGGGGVGCNFFFGGGGGGRVGMQILISIEIQITCDFFLGGGGSGPSLSGSAHG